MLEEDVVPEVETVNDGGVTERAPDGGNLPAVEDSVADDNTGDEEVDHSFQD